MSTACVTVCCVYICVCYVDVSCVCFVVVHIMICVLYSLVCVFMCLYPVVYGVGVVNVGCVWYCLCLFTGQVLYLDVKVVYVMSVGVCCVLLLYGC